MTNMRLNIDMKLALINFNDSVKFKNAGKNVIVLVNTLLVIIRRIIFTLYYRSDNGVTNSDILCEWLKNVRLINKWLALLDDILSSLSPVVGRYPMD